MIVFGNSILSPVPDWLHSTKIEIMLWGLLLSIALVIGGKYIYILFTDSDRSWLYLIFALVSLAASVFFASRAGIRHANQRYQLQKSQVTDNLFLAKELQQGRDVRTTNGPRDSTLGG